MLRARLEEAECEAMDEIMGMVGLRQVKQTALSLFEILLANRALVEQGHHKAATPMTLNFVFLGNPGCVRLGSYDFLAATTFVHGSAFSWRASPFVLVMFLLYAICQDGKDNGGSPLQPFVVPDRGAGWIQVLANDGRRGAARLARKSSPNGSSH